MIAGDFLLRLKHKVYYESYIFNRWIYGQDQNCQLSEQKTQRKQFG